MGPADSAVPSDLLDPLPVDLKPNRTQLFDHALGPTHASLPESLHLALEAGGLVRIEIAEYVDFALGHVCAELDARDDGQGWVPLTAFEGAG